MKLSLLVQMILIVVLSIPVYAEEVPQKVNNRLGSELVYLITKHKGILSVPGVYDHFDDPEHPFLMYHLLGEHSGTAGWFAVNIWTGDVWNTMGGDNCIHYDTPALRQEIDKIKARFTKAELREYKRLSELRPGRISDLGPCGSPGGS